ncbi:hypothetical protein COU61_01665 [Candidatus Pacearchaeota archaeon CG10_big_fil_rev_8_21_14_0_10_35_13]|nr:MAG: hypothetical protein COU61_01665 [Candidatus Pacearchaeota archaeon CG10_big_fil_rev_8_21_14_0_10_35_13]
MSVLKSSSSLVLLLVLALLILTPSVSPTPLLITNTSTSSEVINSLSPSSSDGSFFGAGMLVSGSGYTSLVKKYSSTGAILWNVSLSKGSYLNLLDYNNGLLVVAGYGNNNRPDNNIMLFFINDSGSLTMQVNISRSVIKDFRDLALDSSGNVFVAGLSGDVGVNMNTTVVKVLSNGSIGWVNYYDFGVLDNAEEVSVISGGVIVSGVSKNSNSDNNTLTLMKILDNGTTSWVNGSLFLLDSSRFLGSQLVVGSNNHYYLSSSYIKEYASDYYTLLDIDSAGSIVRGVSKSNYLNVYYYDNIALTPITLNGTDYLAVSSSATNTSGVSYYENISLVIDYYNLSLSLVSQESYSNGRQNVVKGATSNSLGLYVLSLTSKVPVNYVDPESRINLLVLFNNSLGSNNTINNTNSSDTTAPIITIYSPIKGSLFNHSNVDLEVSSNEPSTFWYSINGGFNVSFIPNITFLGLSDGVYSLLVYANDSSGNIGSSSVSFVVNTSVSDITSPNITSVLTIPSLSLSNNGTSVNLSISFVSDEYPLNISFVLYNSSGAVINTTDYSLNDNSSIPLIFTIPSGLSNDTYTLNMTASDSLDNYVTKIVGSVLVSRVGSFSDTTPPVIAVISPSDGSSYSTSSVFINVSTDEPSTTWFSFDGGVTNTTFNNTYTLSGLADGVYSLLVYANDSSGNLANKSLTFIISTGSGGGGGGGGGGGSGGSSGISSGSTGGSGNQQFSYTSTLSGISNGSVGTFRFSVSGPSITEVEVNASNSFLSPSITVTYLYSSDDLSTLPSLVNNSVYHYESLSYSNLHISDISYPIIIKFRVSKQWFVDNNLSAADVILKAYYNGSWHDLFTSYDYDPSGYHYYKATLNDEVLPVFFAVSRNIVVASENAVDNRAGITGGVVASIKGFLSKFSDKSAVLWVIIILILLVLLILLIRLFNTSDSDNSGVITHE